MEDIVNTSEYLNFRLMSEDLSAKIYLESISEAKKVFNEIIRLGSSKNVFAYVFNCNDTYKRIDLSASNAKEWDKFVPNDVILGKSATLMGTSKFNGKLISLELFVDTCVSNMFDAERPTVYVKYLDENNCNNYIKKEIYTLDIPDEIKDIVLKYNGELADYNAKTIHFDS